MSTTEVLRSSMKLSTRVYVSECMNACKSVGDTICFVGTTYRSVVILRQTVRRVTSEVQQCKSLIPRICNKAIALMIKPEATLNRIERIFFSLSSQEVPHLWRVPQRSLHHHDSHEPALRQLPLPPLRNASCLGLQLRQPRNRKSSHLPNTGRKYLPQIYFFNTSNTI